MWNCANCRIEIEDNFFVCWNCGADQRGRPDPDFRSQSVIEVEEHWHPETRIERVYAYIFPFLILATLVAMLLSLILGGLGIVFIVFLVGVAANLLAFLGAIIITYLFGLPNDGRLRAKYRDPADD